MFIVRVQNLKNEKGVINAPLLKCGFYYPLLGGYKSYVRNRWLYWNK